MSDADDIRRLCNSLKINYLGATIVGTVVHYYTFKDRETGRHFIVTDEDIRRSGRIAIESELFISRFAGYLENSINPN